MSVNCQAICEAIESLAPKYLAEEWDNSGLQVGNPRNAITKVLIALDVTMDVIRQAKERKAQMIIAHHPLIFRPLKSLRTDRGLGSIIGEAIKNDLVIYAAHTNLDSAREGLNHLLARKFDLRQAEILSATYEEKLLKIVVFVPVDFVDAVRDAMAEAGAGWIGDYSHCFFQTKGTGTFMPGAGTNPFIGRQGVLERVEECRVETIVREKQLKQILAAMCQAHPYEEVAYDLYPLANTGERLGFGRVGDLPKPSTVHALAERVKAVFGCTTVKIAGDTGKYVHKVAICGGSGATMIGAAVAAGADVFITGDIKYHEAREAIAQGLTIIDAGHFATEQVIVSFLADYLHDCARARGWDLEIVAAREQDVFSYL